MTSASDLRGILSDTINGVLSGKITKEQAETVAKLAQTIVNTAKVEVDAARHAVTSRETSFISDNETVSIGRTVHKLR